MRRSSLGARVQRGRPGWLPPFLFTHADVHAQAETAGRRAPGSNLMLETDSTRHFTSMMDRVPLLLTFTQRSVTATCAGITPPRGKALTKMRMTRKSPKSFLDAKSCVESVSGVLFCPRPCPDRILDVSPYHPGHAIVHDSMCTHFAAKLARVRVRVRVVSINSK